MYDVDRCRWARGHKHDGELGILYGYRIDTVAGRCSGVGREEEKALAFSFTPARPESIASRCFSRLEDKHLEDTRERENVHPGLFASV